MALDGVKNFAKVTVSTGYDASATSIVLSSGHGAKLPDPATANYNLVWWDSTNYVSPEDDPNVEIVRCTAKSTDTLTIIRAQESTSATTKNTGGATYKMILSLTAKMITDIASVVNNTSGTNTGDQALPTDATISTTDVTTNDVSTSKHGWTPKAPNDITKFLRGDATWDKPFIRVYKTADETVNNSNTYQADNHLTMVVEAKIYLFRLYIWGTQANATPGLKLAFYTDTADNFTVSKSSVGNTTDETLNEIVGVEVTQAGTTGISQTSTTTHWKLAGAGLFINSGVISFTAACTLTVNWAQSTAHASDTKLLKGSYLELIKVN